MDTKQKLLSALHQGKENAERQITLLEIMFEDAKQQLHKAKMKRMKYRRAIVHFNKGNLSKVAEIIKDKDTY